MSSPTSSSPVTNVGRSGQLMIDALVDGAKWSPTGSTTTITYSFPWTDSTTASFGGANGGQYSKLDEANATRHFGLSAVEQVSATSALQSWANVANISFKQIADTATSVGDIRIGWTSATDTVSDGSASWGWAYSPDARNPTGGDIWISTESSASTSSGGWVVGSYNYQALMHEIGHAIGLKHPFEDGITLDTAHANRQYSLMAYDDTAHSLYVDVTHTSRSDSWKAYYVVPDTPMVYDIAAIQYLYGANTSYHTGADVYTFDPTVPFLRTIWDAGGNDTISVSNFTNGCRIDLQEGHYSSISIPSDSAAGVDWTSPPPKATYDGTDNLGIAYGAVIENAIGGFGDDTLIGNAAANHLQGNGGINALLGGAGIDTAVYAGNYADYAIDRATSVNGYTVVLRGGGQADGLIEIERLAFKNGTMALNMNSLAEDALQAQYLALAQKFYVGYFGRPADAGGLANMAAQFAAAKVPTTTRGFVDAYDTNATVKSLIDSFGNSTESAALYHGSNQDFVTAIYDHLLGRAPDAEGLKFWTDALNGGGLARGLAALTIMAGAEANTTTQGLADAVLVANRVTVAGNFTMLLDQPLEVAGYAGEKAAALARALLDGVNKDTSIFAYEGTVIDTVAKMASGVSLIGQGAPAHEGWLG